MAHKRKPLPTDNKGFLDMDSSEIYHMIHGISKNKRKEYKKRADKMGF